MNNPESIIDIELLKDTASYLVNPPKGILAADESAKTCCKRFDGVLLECTDESRRAFREMIITAPENEEVLSGIILTDETIRQANKEGKLFAHILFEKGIKPGIKVDTGVVGYRNENDIEFVTNGIDGLEKRMVDYKNFGAAFAKWRAVFGVNHGIPTKEALAENISRMCQYAEICQENNIVPIVEPEVLIDGNHSIVDCEETLQTVLIPLMNELKASGAYLPGLILKTSMVLSGKNAENRAKPEEVAERTISVLKESLPNNIGGVIFLSGGQSHDEADENFDAIMRLSDQVPFPMTFSFSRAFQNEALAHYAKDPKDILGAQKVLLKSIKDIISRK